MGKKRSILACICVAIVAAGAFLALRDGDSGGNSLDGDGSSREGDAAFVPNPPKLTAEQERQAIRIAREDPTIKVLVHGRKARFGLSGPWTRPGRLELLGAGINVKFRPQGDFRDLVWPTITNKEALYGKGYDQEGGGGDDIEPGVRPEIGSDQLSARNLGSIIAMVDLESNQVAEIHVSDPRARIDFSR